MAFSRAENAGSFVIDSVALQSSNVTNYAVTETLNSERVATIAQVDPKAVIQNSLETTVVVDYILESGNYPTSAEDVVSLVCIYTLPGEYTETFTATATDATWTIDPDTAGRINCQITLGVESAIVYATLS